MLFLKRLAEHRTEYWLEKCPVGDAIRVHTWAANERWEVDFWENGDIEAECFRSNPREKLTGEVVLDSLFGRMGKAWVEAARDLEIEFVRPFVLIGEGGREVRCAGLLPQFGGPKGTVIVSREDPDEASELAEAQGYYTSGLNPRIYESYDREIFVETLSDWGWHGSEAQRPTWLPRQPSFTGPPS
jgi:hypothetical protein